MCNYSCTQRRRRIEGSGSEPFERPPYALGNRRSFSVSRIKRVPINQTSYQRDMRRFVTTVGISAAVLLLVTIGSAAANPSPNGPGQPGAPNTTCQQYNATPGQSLGTNSVFNGSGQASAVYAGNANTSSLNHSASNLSVSQYDIACFQQFSH